MGKTTRRTAVKGLAMASVATGQAKGYDVAVIGAGVFGSWTAYWLRRAGKKVVLVDGYGAGNARASSGGESRIIRCGYGADEVYSLFAQRSLVEWKALGKRSGTKVFDPVGVLWLGRNRDTRMDDTGRMLDKIGVPIERLTRGDVERRFPQFAMGDLDRGVFEPGGGALLARRSVQVLVEEMRRGGMEMVLEPVAGPKGGGKLDAVTTAGGRKITADAFVFACGPWLGKVFPEELGERIFPTRQEIFFFGAAAGDRRFAGTAMPCWIVSGSLYGLPDLENRGFKIADDEHGAAIDPDTADRVVSAASVAKMRRLLGERFPAMKNAPLVETRVCQYENTSNGDFLLDRHPGFANVWVAGGGSGHGFKHGPAVGEYLAGRVMGTRKAEARFGWAGKEKVQKRAVY